MVMARSSGQQITDDYGRIFKECLLLIQNSYVSKWTEIKSNFLLGSLVNNLMEMPHYGHQAIVKMARELSIATGKVIHYQRLYECRQVYVKFLSLEKIKELEGQLGSDLSWNSLVRGLKNDKSRKTTTIGMDLNRRLEKLNSLLEKLEEVLAANKLTTEENRVLVMGLESFIKRSTELLNQVSNGVEGNRESNCITENSDNMG